MAMTEHLRQSVSPGIEARVGARWWADKIRKGFVADAGARPGDALAHPMSVGLVSTLQRKVAESVTPEKVDAYEMALAGEIQAIIDKYGTATYFGASESHVKALKAAGLPTVSVILPWKTTMWVEPGRVSVGDGYGAASVDLPLEEPSEPPSRGRSGA
jgi:hypothetical protein